MLRCMQFVSTPTLDSWTCQPEPGHHGDGNGHRKRKHNKIWNWNTKTSFATIIIINIVAALVSYDFHSTEIYPAFLHILFALRQLHVCVCEC